MKRSVRGQDLETAGVMAKFPSEFVKAFIRFSAAIAEEATAGSDQPNERFGELGLRLGEVKVGNMEKLAGLLEQRVRDLRVGVSEGADRDASAEIEIPATGNVDDVAAFAMIERKIEARVGRDDVSLEKFPDVA